jgi:hypothetical protein
MKNFLRTILPAVLLMTFLGGSALAQTKIATVDLRKLFDGYWKTKQAQADIKEQQTQLDKDAKAMLDDYKKAGDEYQQLLTQEDDPAISADERDRRKQKADDKPACPINSRECVIMCSLTSKLMSMQRPRLAVTPWCLTRMRKAPPPRTSCSTTAAKMT